MKRIKLILEFDNLEQLQQFLIRHDVPTISASISDFDIYQWSAQFKMDFNAFCVRHDVMTERIRYSILRSILVSATDFVWDDAAQDYQEVEVVPHIMSGETDSLPTWKEYLWQVVRQDRAVRNVGAKTRAAIEKALIADGDESPA